MPWLNAVENVELPMEGRILFLSDGKLLAKEKHGTQRNK